MPSGKKRKRHKVATHKRKKRSRANRHKTKKQCSVRHFKNLPKRSLKCSFQKKLTTATGKS